MTDDEDALTWDGGFGDPTHADAAEQHAGHPEVTERTADATGSALLVGYGVIAGAYLLFVVGWFVGVQRDTFGNAIAGASILEVMYRLGEFLAIAAPVLWFTLALLMTRARKPLVRVAWLLAGLPLLAPWPFLLAQASA